MLLGKLPRKTHLWRLIEARNKNKDVQPGASPGFRSSALLSSRFWPRCSLQFSALFTHPLRTGKTSVLLCFGTGRLSRQSLPGNTDDERALGGKTLRAAWAREEFFRILEVSPPRASSVVGRKQ